MLRDLALAACVGACTLACSSASLADTPPITAKAKDFRWRKKIDAPKRLEVHDRNGSIRGEASHDDALEIVAVKSGRPEDTARVSIVVEDRDGVIVACALWPGETGCLAHGSSRDEVQVRVDFVVRVPAKIASYDAATMNGAIATKDLTAPMKLKTMNGDVDVVGSGKIDAETMNGKISARVRTDAALPIRLATKNGSVNLVLPADAGAEVEASTMRGKIVSPFGDVGPTHFPGLPRSARFRVGGGGAAVKLETMNGDIVVERAGG